MSTPAQGTDYLAVILIAGGSSWGRHPDKAKAIKAALRIYKADWGKLFKIRKGDEVVVNVVDVFPHNEVRFGDRGFWIGDSDEKLDRKIEHVTAMVP